MRAPSLGPRLSLFSDVSYLPLKKRVENWVELTFAKISGAVTRNWEKNWPIADRCVPSNYPRNNFGAHSDSSHLLVSKVVNRLKDDVNLGHVMEILETVRCIVSGHMC